MDDYTRDEIRAGAKYVRRMILHIVCPGCDLIHTYNGNMDITCNNIACKTNFCGWCKIHKGSTRHELDKYTNIEEHIRSVHGKENVCVSIEAYKGMMHRKLRSYLFLQPQEIRDGILKEILPDVVLMHDAELAQIVCDFACNDPATLLRKLEAFYKDAEKILDM